MRTALISVALGALALGCGSDPDFPNRDCGDFDTANCVRIPSGDSAALLDAVNSLSPDTTVLLGIGTYELDLQVTIRADGINLVGQGMEETTLSFGTAAAQINGVDVVGDDFLIEDLTVLDVPKDGIRVEDSDGVTYRRIRVTWTTPAQSTNGAYGIYPVSSSNVLVEDSIAEHASDAGLYVGQCLNVIVRNNIVRGNVAGLEIENTQYADVYGNTATGNTAGIVVFDLPGNPVVGRDVRLRDNMIVDNNLTNFAPGGTVAVLPAGTGTFAMASRRVEITGNTYRNNRTGDIAIISGLLVDEDPAMWVLETATLRGDWEDLDLMPGPTSGTILNFRTENVVIAGNSHADSGLEPDTSKEMGQLLAILFFPDPTPSVLYDGIGETTATPTEASNVNHICAGGNTMGNGFASMNVAAQLETSGMSPFYQTATSPFAPFDCTALDGGPVAEVVLP